jgi:hypothetical protein
MAAAIAQQLPWCPPSGTATYSDSPTCCITSLCHKTRKYYCFYYLLAILRHNTSSMHCQCTMPVCLRVASMGGAESIILSVGGAESMMLSARAESMDPLSAGADGIILSALPAESMMLSALFGCVIALTAGGYKKNNNQQY